MRPLAPERYGIQFTIGAEDQELLKHAQDLLGHEVACDDIGAVFVRALRVFVQQLEKRKLAATDRPLKHPRESKNTRHIPAGVRRAVRERDGGRCTFAAENGHRCEARRDLEFDHIEPVARGGKSTASNLRLRCRAHNQYAAEQTYGADLMRGKRDAARGSASCSLSGGSAFPQVCGQAGTNSWLAPLESS